MGTNNQFKPPPQREFTREEKAIRVLTRCGPYSRMQAQDLILLLDASEMAELVQLHDHLAGPRASLAELLSRISDRLHPPEKPAAAHHSPDGIPDLDPGTVLPVPAAAADPEATDLE